MDKAVKLQVRRELNDRQQLNIVKLKGNLVSKEYIEIMHTLDLQQEFDSNSFETPLENCNEVQEFIAVFINQKNPIDNTYCPYLNGQMISKDLS